jgi:hypothetical protein
MNRPVALCAVCHRQFVLRKDGRLRAHLANRGHRGECEGSGQFSARVTMLGAGGGLRLDIDPDSCGWDLMTPAQRFNATEEWAKVYALFDELHAMCDTGAADQAAVDAADAALRRAYTDAKALAPMGVMRGAWAWGETA